MQYNAMSNCDSPRGMEMPEGIAVPGYKDMPDDELVSAYVEEQDGDAFSEIIDRYADRIYKTALRILNDPGDAEDTLQEVFLILATKAGTFRGESKFSTWLYTIALNVSYMRIRADKKIHANEVSLENYAPYDESGSLGDVVLKDFSRRPDSELLGREGVGIIMNAVNELPDAYRIVFHLMHEQGLTAGEAANALGISLSSAKSRIHRAKLFLRDRLADYYYEMAR
ncbi:MAG TPA: sigma-70 family RNA polymerase sigma factor [Thermodesulfobacteriota bacterium]|nr:sigma-70 family RNA polymerase sigma factor [Thermodesulfobacteriota bacterium]